MTDRIPPSSWASTRPTRRGFLAGCATCATALGLGAGLATAPARRASAASVERGLVRAHPSPWFTRMDDRLVQCTLCPRACVVPDGKRGHCEVRENRGGEYHSLVYGNPCSIHPDPVEKKPFFHVLPGSKSFSLATAGCNFDCKFCQNWEISQTTPELTFNYDLPPDEIVALALEYECATIASTYVEPTVFFEYMLDIAVAATPRGVRSVMHSNGFISQAPQDQLMEHLSAACIDLKGITEDYYREMTGGRLAPVQDSLKRYRERGVHLELVTLMVPTHNDAPDDVRRLCDWVVEALGPDTPIHFSRFMPLYKLTHLPPTPVETLERAHAIAGEAGLRYAYLGNVPGNDAENTYCPACRELLIRRVGYRTEVVALTGGRCTHCDQVIPGIWE